MWRRAVSTSTICRTSSISTRHRIGRTGRIGREGVAITLVDPRDRWLMRNIEAFTKQEINLMPVPTLADLRARQLDDTRARLQARLAAAAGVDAPPDVSTTLNEMRIIVDSLKAEFDLRDIAAAAIEMVHDAGRIAVVAAPAAGPSASADRHAQSAVERSPAARPRRWSLDPRAAAAGSARGSSTR
jgi:ATP-dependent RNA helicase DeaD